MDHLMRGAAPLTSQQWAALDGAVVATARSQLVGRRFLPLVGPFGAGLQALPDDRLAGGGEGHIDLLGEQEDAVHIERRRYIPLPLLYKDFWLFWRDIEAAEQFHLPLDTSKAAMAAGACANAEDSLVFNGDPEFDTPGLLTVDGRQHAPLRDWEAAGEAFLAVVAGIRVLTDADFYGPYALITSPRLYARLNRIFENSGVLELEQIEKLVRAGVYQTSVIPDTAMLVAVGSQNVDLAIGFDLTTAFVESTNLNYHLRVLESVTLRIKRPAAVLTFDV
jgi:uncharacterized linocin/CFP29 family protein